MATFTKVICSGSTNGKGVKITGTASGSANTIHSTGTSSTTLDEIWIWVVNSSTSAVKATCLFGATASPDNEIEVTVPGESGLMLVVPGLILSGTGAASNTVSMFAASGSALIAYGYVNRIA